MNYIENLAVPHVEASDEQQHLGHLLELQADLLRTNHGLEKMYHRRPGRVWTKQDTRLD